MADFSTFWAGFTVFIICCIVGLVMSWVGGGLIDRMHEEAKTLPYADSDMTEAMQGDIYWFINAYYLITYLIPVLGAIIFGQSILKRVRTSRYTWR